MDVPYRHSLLMSLGLTPERAHEVIAHIDNNGCSLSVVGIHKLIVKTINSLHLAVHGSSLAIPGGTPLQKVVVAKAAISAGSFLTSYTMRL